MIDKNNGIIRIFDSNNNPIEVQLVFGFEVPEFRKKYIAYTYEAKKEVEDIDVLISEIDYDTNQVKKIPSDEINLVLEYYNSAKKLLLENSE